MCHAITHQINHFEAGILAFGSGSLSAQEQPLTIGGVELPIRGGLALVHGEAGLAHAQKLAASGKWLVHMVSSDPAERGRMLQAVSDLVPVITVGPMNGDLLPFGPDSVNLIIQNPSAAISSDEVSRVLAPQGGCLVAPWSSSAPA